MADLRPVTFQTREFGAYKGWINFDRVKFIEDQGTLDGKHVAMVVMDREEDNAQIRVDVGWTGEGRKRANT